MKITVTQKDINKGIPRIGDKCPIALAIKRKTHKYVQVGCTYAWVKLKNRMVTYVLPDTVVQFIKDFDENRKVRPFSVKLKPL